MSRSDHVMKGVRLGLALGLALTLLAPAMCWGEILKVTQSHQSLYPGPDFASASGSEELQAGDWHKEEYQGKTGQVLAQASSILNLPGLITGTPVKETSSDEVALAGKGFTPEVESSYRSKHPEANFAQVDQIEGYKVDSAELQAFIKEGELKP